MSKYSVFLILFCLTLFSGCATHSVHAQRNVILMIGDGMGPEQVKAGSLYATGRPNSLSFQSFPNQAQVITKSCADGPTDSAASATAMATGHKVNNGILSMAIPGNGENLPTLLEQMAATGKKTGLVTTTEITHATPAGFGAHAESRGDARKIVSDYLNRTRPDVLMGGGSKLITPEALQAAGYLLATDRVSLQAVDVETPFRVAGLFGIGHMPYEFDGVGDYPHLSEMTAKALEILERDPDGFFLMVEGGRIDHAGHGNDGERLVPEVVEFSKAVQRVMDWAEGREDTIIIVTADHETGGLGVGEVDEESGLPEMTWGTDGHTHTPVPLYAWGPGAEKFRGTIDNTAIHWILTPAMNSVQAAPDLWMAKEQAVR